MASIWFPKAQTSVGMPWEQENQCVLKGPGTKDSFTEELGSFKSTRLIRGHLPSSRVEGWLHPSGSLRPWFPWTSLKMAVREIIYSHLLVALVLRLSPNPYFYILQVVESHKSPWKGDRTTLNLQPGLVWVGVNAQSQPLVPPSSPWL